MSEYFDLKQTAEKMRISRPTLMKLIKEGKLKTYRIGGPKGRHVVTQEQIDECIKGVSDDHNKQEEI